MKEGKWFEQHSNLAPEWSLRHNHPWASCTINITLETFSMWYPFDIFTNARSSVLPIYYFNVHIVAIWPFVSLLRHSKHSVGCSKAQENEKRVNRKTIKRQCSIIVCTLFYHVIHTCIYVILTFVFSLSAMCVSCNVEDLLHTVVY